MPKATSIVKDEVERIDMGDFIIEFIPIDDIKLDPPGSNPRIHDERNTEITSNSFQEFGPQRGIVINEDNESLAGTGALTAAKKNGVKFVARTIFKDPKKKREILWATVANDLTPEQQDRYRFVDNIAATSGGYDSEVVAAMRDRGSLDGFDEEVQRIIASGALSTDDDGNGTPKPEDKGAKVDEAAKLLKKWKVKPGQIWEIPSHSARGDAHRIMCGDCAIGEDVIKLMAGERATLFGTDPPYAVSYDGRNHPHEWGKGGRSAERQALRDQLPAPVVEALDVQYQEDVEEEFDKEAVPEGLQVDIVDPTSIAQFEEEFYGEWDNLTPEQAAKLWLDYNRNAVEHALKPNAAWYCCHASKHQALMEKIWNQCDAFMHQQIIWVKNRPVFTRSWAMWQHEPIMMGWIKGNKPQRASKHYERTIWNIDTIPPGQHGYHPTEKPVEIFSRMQQQHCKPGEIHYDPFGGSGASMVAGELNRVLVFIMEKNAKWVSVELERASDLGLHPQLIDGPE